MLEVFGQVRITLRVGLTMTDLERYEQAIERLEAENRRLRDHVAALKDCHGLTHWTREQFAACNVQGPHYVTRKREIVDCPDCRRIMESESLSRVLCCRECGVPEGAVHHPACLMPESPNPHSDLPHGVKQTFTHLADCPCGNRKTGDVC